VYDVYDASSPIRRRRLSGSCVTRATHDTEDTYTVLCAPVVGLSVFLRCATPLVRFGTKFTVKTVQNRRRHVSTGHPRCLLPAIMSGIPDSAATRVAEPWHLEFQVKYIWVSLIMPIHKCGRRTVTAHVSCT
jgi:hypothetical protein